MSKDGICRDGKPCPQAPHRNGYPDMTACARNGVCQRAKMDALPTLTVEHLGGNHYRLDTQEPPRSLAQPDAETLLREARRDWLGGHRAGADELEFCARIDAFLRGGSGG